MTTTNATTTPAPMTRVDQIRPGQAIRFSGGHSCIVKDVRTENGYTYITPSYGGTPFALPNTAEVYVFNTFPAAFAVEIEDAHAAALAEDQARASVERTAVRIARIAVLPVRSDAYAAALAALAGRSDREHVFITAYRAERARRADVEAREANAAHAARYGLAGDDTDLYDHDAAERNEWDAADDRNED